MIMLILNIASLLLLGRSWATKQFHKRNETHFTVTRIRWRTPLRQFRERTVGRWRRSHWPRLLAVNSSSRRWPRKWPPIGEEPPLSLSEKNNFLTNHRFSVKIVHAELGRVEFKQCTSALTGGRLKWIGGAVEIRVSSSRSICGHVVVLVTLPKGCRKLALPHRHTWKPKEEL